jgi:glucosyl-3-phosphoglycerate synthase
VLDEVADWLSRRSWTAADRPLPRLLAAKRATGTTVSVVLPALDEEATVGEIVSAIRRDLMVPLVDELVVIDSGSTDRTGQAAAAAGARVVHRDDILPRIPAEHGKGEVLWRSLLVTRGDVVCFIDADLREFDSAFVSGIVGPLLTDPGVAFVKAMYDRPLETETATIPAGGGRVTELVARPLLNLHWPLLAGFVQPLGGEYAARRALLERLPFATGYGVEIGLLVDALELAGLDAGPDGRDHLPHRPGPAGPDRPGEGRRRPGHTADHPVHPGRARIRAQHRGDLDHRPAAGGHPARIPGLTGLHRGKALNHGQRKPG